MARVTPAFRPPLALFWPIRAGLLVPLAPDFLSLGWLNDREMAKVDLAFSPGFGPLLARPGSPAGPNSANLFSFFFFLRIFYPMASPAMARVTLASRL